MNELLDKLSHFIGERPGFLPIIGVVLIVANLLLQFFRGNWVADSNLLLHLGLLTSLIGILLIRPLK